MNEHENQQIIYTLIKEKIAELDQQVRELSKKSRDLKVIELSMSERNSDLV